MYSLINEEDKQDEDEEKGVSLKVKYYLISLNNYK